MTVNGVCKYFGYSRQAWYWRRDEHQKTAEEHEMIVQEVRKLRYDHSRMGGKKLYSLLGEPKLIHKELLHVNIIIITNV